MKSGNDIISDIYKHRAVLEYANKIRRVEHWRSFSVKGALTKVSAFIFPFI